MSLLYNPFTRGPHPVGVRTVTLRDDARDHTLTLEVWYPADGRYMGADIDRRRQDSYFLLRPGPRLRQAAVRDAEPAALQGLPFVLFSHGLGGFRRQSTFLTTHLASHGYVVAAADHPGSTLHDMIRSQGQGLARLLIEAATARVQDAPFIVQTLPKARPELGALLADGVAGMSGHSFGAWTTVAATSFPSPFKAALALAPIGSGENRAWGRDAYERFDLGFTDRPPTLILAADRDSICKLSGVERLHDAIGSRHRLVVLQDAGHLHFLDYIKRFHRSFTAVLAAGRLAGRSSLRITPYRQLMPEDAAHAAVRAVGLAHFDAYLRRKPEAAAFLSEGLTDALAAHKARATIR